MERFINKNKKQKVNIFERVKRIKTMKTFYTEELANLDNELKSMKATLDSTLFNRNSLMESYSILLEKRNKIKFKLDKLNSLAKDLKSSLVKIAVIASAAGIVISAGIISTTKKNNDFRNDLNSSYEIVSQYDSLDNKYEKDFDTIKDSPSDITDLALLTLKSKIAKSLDIQDPTRISVYDNTHEVAKDSSQIIIDKYITVDEKIVAQYKAHFSDETGEISPIINTMPDNINKSLSFIVHSQKSNKKSDAIKALDKVDSLVIEKNSLNLPEENTIEDDELSR